MIEQLRVKDYILFEDTCIDFFDGMSVITGETGAGKSLLIDAIGYLSGNRITSNIVRKGQERAVLQMILSCQDHSVHSYLVDNGFEDDEQIIITRIVNANQKSSIRVNNQVTTLSFVRSLIARIVDVHSQMDTFQLMDPNVQMNVLDSYAHAQTLKEDVKQTYTTYQNLFKEYKRLSEESLSDDELDYITAQFNKIEEVDVQENELEELQARIRQAELAQKNAENYSFASYQLSTDNGILDQLFQVSKALSKSENTESLSNEITDMYYRLEDINESLKDILSNVYKDVDDLDALQAREHDIRTLFKRYGGTYESLMEQKEAYEKQIDRILHRDDILQKLKVELDKSLNAYDKAAKKLSKQRKSVLKELSQQVEAHCKDLMLENAKFKIEISEKEKSSDGIDQIQFMISMNPGQPFALLKESASGGELSRLMLALKVVFQTQSGIETIIFDEIDTGVSGKVALAMGKKMHVLSKEYQVLCITHLASVAAWADDHYRVYKDTDGQQTTTTVETLNDSSMLEELAIMSSGSINQASLEAAKELKERVNHG